MDIEKSAPLPKIITDEIAHIKQNTTINSSSNIVNVKDEAMELTPISEEDEELIEETSSS